MMMDVKFNDDILMAIDDYITSTDRNPDIPELLEYLKAILTTIYTDKYIFNDSLYQYIYKVIDPHSKRFNFNPTSSELTSYRQITQELLNKPQFEQRSEGWYADRYNKITASDCNGILTSKSRELEIMMRKLDPLSKLSILEGDAILHGKEYEQVITEATEERFSTKIYEYGCVTHHTHSFIGASPDGIMEDGTMIEIKCPYSRVIEGLPVKDYWVQMQLQMECCNLNICYFIEGKITKYEDEHSFLEDRDSDKEYLRKNGNEKGLIIAFVKDGKEQCKYPENTVKWNWEELSEWRDKVLLELIEDNSISLIREDFFKVDTYSLTPVYRDREWFANIFPIFKDFWDKVLEHRKNGTKPDNTKKVKKATTWKKPVYNFPVDIEEALNSN